MTGASVSAVCGLAARSNSQFLVPVSVVSRESRTPSALTSPIWILPRSRGMISISPRTRSARARLPCGHPVGLPIWTPWISRPGWKETTSSTEPSMVMSRPRALVAAASTLLLMPSRLIVTPSFMAIATAAINTMISMPIEKTVQPNIFLIFILI